MLQNKRARSESLALVAIVFGAIAAIVVSIALTREEVRSTIPQIVLADELERVPGGSPAVDAVFVNGRDTALPSLGRTVPSDAVVDVFGWAVDDHEGDTAAGVVLFVDDRVIRAAYGQPRPDVVAATHRENLRNSGFHLQIPRGMLERGAHSVMWGVVAHSGIRVAISKTQTLTVR